MFVAWACADLHFPGARSLKSKRAVVSRVKGRLIQRFRASVAEVEYQELWQRSRLGLALVGDSPSQLRDALGRMRFLIEADRDLELVGWTMEIQKLEMRESFLMDPGPSAHDGDGAWE
jgi:hypothetical protein